MLQTEDVALVKVTANPDVAVADTVPVPLTLTLGAVPKLMV